MIASVTITFSVPAGEKHQRQMRRAAESLTNAKSSIQILQPSGEPNRLTARFSVPTARQGDVVDHIGRRFWDFIEDYSDSSIGFGPEPRRTRRSSQTAAALGIIIPMSIVISVASVMPWSAAVAELGRSLKT